MPNILIINGSIQGHRGNTQKVLLQYMDQILVLNPQTQFDFWTLNDFDFSNKSEIQSRFSKADAVVFTTGTYWSSWGSPMQKLLEEMTFLEGRSEILGKPASMIVTMHSVGGLEVCSRLQGVLVTMGFLIPPMCHLVFSLAGHLASSSNSEFADDFWSLQDLSIIAKNLLISITGGSSYQAWAVDHADPKRLWLKS